MQINLGKIKGDDGGKCYIRYSAYENGQNKGVDSMSTTWTHGLNFIGFEVAKEEPLTAGEYKWSKFIPDNVVFNTQVKQSTGDSTTDIMSQKAVTDSLNKKTDYAKLFYDNGSAVPQYLDANKWYNLPETFKENHEYLFMIRIGAGLFQTTVNGIYIYLNSNAIYSSQGNSGIYIEFDNKGDNGKSRMQILGTDKGGNRVIIFERKLL